MGHQEGRHTQQTGQTNRRAPGDNQKHERSVREHGETQSAGVKGHVGGQGMGQGRGMNAGEVHHRNAAPELADDNDRAEDNDQKGGDRSNRAAQSGATGERHPGGGRNKPATRDQDEKGMGHPRNR